MMPMKTDAKDISTQLKWRLTLDQNSSLLLGQEYYNYRIDDWWPAIEGSTMMGPNDYININSGKRERIALFVEYESQINNKLWLNTGLRVERVNTQVDEVQAYNDGMMNMGSMSAMTTANNALAANNFNNADRDITDTLVDVNVLANYLSLIHI